MPRLRHLFERTATVRTSLAADAPVRERRVVAGGHPLSPRPQLELVADTPEPACAPVVGVARVDDAALLALVRRIQAGELGAFELLYRHTREDVARTLHHLVGPRAELEDLLQETYLKLLKAVRSFRGEAQFRTFLYRVCSNVALMHLRWRRRRPEDVMAELPERASLAPDPEGEAARRQAARLVEAALEGLTAKKRIVFVYHELCGMGPEEIAAIVGTSPNTVRSRLHHARLEFAQAMERLLCARAPGGRHG